EPADVVEDRFGDFAVGGVEDDQRDVEAVLVPAAEKVIGVGLVDLDGDRVQRVRSGGFGVGDRPHGGQVQAGDEHDRVVAGGQHGFAGARQVQFAADRVVVTADAFHHREGQRHGEDGDPGALRDLGGQHDHEHHGGGHRADG